MQQKDRLTLNDVQKIPFYLFNDDNVAEIGKHSEQAVSSNPDESIFNI